MINIHYSMLIINLLTKVLVRGTAWAAGYLNDEGIPVDQFGNEDIAWYGGDHGMVDMSYGHFGMGLVNL